MNAAVRTLRFSKILIVSQLRSSRSESGRTRLRDRPAFILMTCILALLVSLFASLEILILSQPLSDSLVRTVSEQALAFAPMLILALVIMAGVLFELNTSSRFASSDLANWLPISKSEYVAASAVSVAYIYSPYLCIVAGITLALSVQMGLVSAWAISFALSVVSLLTGGFLIEIIRASINRVYSAMSKKTGRATLVVRLALIVFVIVGFQAAFNPNLLFRIMNGVSGALDASFFLPPVWASIAILAVAAGDLARSMMFAVLTGVFALAVFLAAVTVRSRYWAPSPASIAFSGQKGYGPRSTRLGRLGFSGPEASMLSKDLKGYFRERQLLPYLALPFTLTAVVVLQQITISNSGGGPDSSWLVAILAGFSAIFVSASSIGEEGKNILNMYIAPINAKQLLRAKAASSLVISLGGALTMSLIATVVFGLSPANAFKALFMSSLVSVQSVFLALCFATRFSDFAERPKPRYISNLGMLEALGLGIAGVILTASPVFFLFQAQPLLSALATTVLFLMISTLAYRFSLRGAESLMTKMKI